MNRKVEHQQRTAWPFLRHNNSNLTAQQPIFFAFVMFYIYLFNFIYTRFKSNVNLVFIFLFMLGMHTCAVQCVQHSIAMNQTADSAHN